MTDESMSPTWEKPCEECNEPIARWRGDGDVSCDNCHALYNTFGQRLRDDAYLNPSMYDDEISDLDGYEMAHADDY